MFKIYNDRYLADKIGVDKRRFHREIKPLIIKEFKAELKEKGISNPDIGLNKEGLIFLVDSRDNSRFVETGENIKFYL